MPDGNEAARERPESTRTIGFTTTPEFDTALVGAGRPLAHAASRSRRGPGR